MRKGFFQRIYYTYDTSVRPAKSIKLDVAVKINKYQLFKTKYWISPKQHEVIHWVHCVSPCSCILGGNNYYTLPNYR